MAKDWEKIAGERGAAVPSGRLSRMLKLGTMGARVGVSSLASKLKHKILPPDASRDQDTLSEAYTKNAAHMAQVLGQLKGASMKVGQLLSADPELLPPEFAEELTSLQRDAPPMTYMTVRDQVESGLGRPIETIFSWFDPEPVGSASIGQVHRARLDSGEEVAVKVQYPGVADSLVSDMKSLKSMLIYGSAVIARDRLDEYFAEIKEVLIQEADYRREAQNLARFHDLLSSKQGLRAPKPFGRWCSESVLVMEYVEGEKLDDRLEALGPGPARQALLARWVGSYVWMVHELMELHADPHPGNFLVDEQDTLVMLDFGCVRQLDEDFADGILRILDSAWAGEPARAQRVYAEIGFGARGPDASKVDPALIADYHDIILAPFLRDEEFAFGGWTPAADARRFMLGNPSFFKLVPPSRALLYFRVLSAIKGLLYKLDARLNVYEMAADAAAKRGVLTAV